MTSGADILRSAFADSCQTLRQVLSGVTHAEFFWGPVDGCWTVHRRSEPRGVSADGSGEWVIDYDPSQPRPAPFTTLAWRTVHIAAVNYLYFNYAVGSASLTFDLEIPGDVAEATGWLLASHEPLTAALAGLSDTDLDRLAPVNWGGRWPLHKIVATLINEQVHHGAEISMLRDLYWHRDSLGPKPPR